MWAQLLSFGLEPTRGLHLLCIRDIRPGPPHGGQSKTRQPNRFWKETRPKSEESNSGRVTRLDYFEKYDLHNISVFCSPLKLFKRLF